MVEKVFPVRDPMGDIPWHRSDGMMIPQHAPLMPGDIVYAYRTARRIRNGTEFTSEMLARPIPTCAHRVVSVDLPVLSNGTTLNTGHRVIKIECLEFVEIPQWWYLETLSMMPSLALIIEARIREEQERNRCYRAGVIA